MKYFLTALTIFFSITSGTNLKADMEEMAELMRTEIKQTSLNEMHRSKTVETHFVKYLIASDGSIMHFGIWSDCLVGTVVGNANNIGSQLIMLNNGDVLDASNDYSVHGRYFVNKYWWGKVYSYDNKQIIERK